MKSGQVVEIIDFRGRKLRRIVVDVLGDVILICKKEEFEEAKKHRSLPWCVGFKKSKVSKLHESKGV
jgi:hypothetical protein